MVGRFVDWIFVLAALIGLAATGWWAVYAGQNNANALENTLQEQANTALSEAGIDWANVVMDGQHAKLIGATPNFDAQEAALLSLGDASPLRGGITKITSEIVSAPPVSPFIWTAEKFDDGTIRLSGHVPSAEIRDILMTRAEEIASGKPVSELNIAAGAPRGAWDDAAMLGLSTLQALDHGTATLTDLNLIVTGQASNRNIVADVEEAVRTVGSPFSASSTVSTGFDWNARFDGEALILDGIISNEEDRRVILAAAEGSFQGVVRDNMLVQADAASPWRDTVVEAFPQFSKFKSGLMSARSDPQSLRVRGEAYGSVEAFLKEDLSNSVVPVDISLDIIAVEIAELSDLDLSVPSIEGCQQGFDAVMSANTVLFESGSALIDRTSGLTLDKIMQVAKQCSSFSLEVHGHTDTAGDRQNNIRLSQSRAGAVKLYMLNRGIDADRITTYGSGPDNPIADNQTASGRAKNRRIEFKIAGEG